MNDLSWLIYLADIAENTSQVLGVGLSIGAILLFFGSIFGAGAAADGDISYRTYKIFLCSIVLFLFTAGSVRIVTPSKDTVYAIAVSETGEEILKSETGSKALFALNNWIDKQLENTLPNKKEETNDKEQN